MGNLATRTARALTPLRAACVMALACIGLTGAAAPASAQPGGPYAIHSMLQLNSPFAFKQAMFAAAATAGASEIRVDVSLGALNNPWIETATWQGLDDYMQLSREYALPVLVDLNASNDTSLESCLPGVDPSRGVCGIGDLDGYYNEVAALVQHTRGVIDDFEIVNEPDATWAFSGTPQQYAGMLATAYTAVHANDPAGRMVLGGIMTTADMSWLATVFATPGFDAAHKFDVANVHLRDALVNLPGEVIAWRKFFTFFGDGNLPLWVTEVGYPADPAYQYDPAFRGSDPGSGQTAQANYLAKALPVLLFAGAARVFVTERDNLVGAYASEGLLGGQVTDSQADNPTIIPRPAYTIFAQLAAGPTAAGDPPPLATPPAPAPVSSPPPVAVPTTPSAAPARTATKPAASRGASSLPHTAPAKRRAASAGVASHRRPRPKPRSAKASARRRGPAVVRRRG
jgi:hypothetical protein